MKNIFRVGIGHTKAPQRAKQVVELALVRVETVVRHCRGTCGFRGDLQVLESQPTMIAASRSRLSWENRGKIQNDGNVPGAATGLLELTAGTGSPGRFKWGQRGRANPVRMI